MFTVLVVWSLQVLHGCELLEVEDFRWVEVIVMFVVIDTFWVTVVLKVEVFWLEAGVVVLVTAQTVVDTGMLFVLIVVFLPCVMVVHEVA